MVEDLEGNGGEGTQPPGDVDFHRVGRGEPERVAKGGYIGQYIETIQYVTAESTTQVKARRLHMGV